MVHLNGAVFSGLLLLLVLVSGRPAQADKARTTFYWYAPKPPQPGTVVVQDKLRGLIWLLNLKQRSTAEILLPFNGGNHESALTPDGRWLATGHYETIPVGSSALSGIPGEEISLVDIQSRSARVYPTAPSPKPASKSHGVLWLPDGRLAVTAELANAVLIYPPPGRPGRANVFELASTGCRTPHMLRQLPGSTLLLVTCRATNPGDSDTTQGYLVAIDLQRQSVRAIASGLGAEGLVVTPQSEVWVGNLRENTVSIFGFNENRNDPNALVLRDQLIVPSPMRLAYEPTTNRVGIISSGASSGAINFRSFNAQTHKLADAVILSSRQRGWVNPQGLFAIPGMYITGGINNQAVLFIDAKTLGLKGEVLLPRCPLSADAANRSCLATMRNPNGTTPAMLDGFAWTPQTPVLNQKL